MQAAMCFITNKSFPFIWLVLIILGVVDRQLPVNQVGSDVPTGSPITYQDHKWSLMAKVVEVEAVSALGSRGRAALLAYPDAEQNSTGYAWVLLDLQGYDYDPGVDDVSAGQEVLVYISGDYVDERGIDYERCSNEAGDYCTVLSLVEGAYPKSIDMHNLAMSPGNQLIHHGSSSRNWWNGMLAWKLVVPEKMPGNDQ